MQWNHDVTEVSSLNAVELGCMLKGGSNGCWWPPQVRIKMNGTQLHSLTAENKWAIFDVKGKRPPPPNSAVESPNFFAGCEVTRHTLALVRASGASATSETAPARLRTASALCYWANSAHMQSQWQERCPKVYKNRFRFSWISMWSWQHEGFTFPWHQKGKGKEMII